MISNSKPREAESRRWSFKDRHRWLLLRRRESVCEIEKEEALELEEKREKLRTIWLGERKKNKKVKSEMQSYSSCVNIHGYCSNNENLHKFSSTDVRHFWGKMCKIVYFFYFERTDAVALRLANFLIYFFHLQTINKKFWQTLFIFLSIQQRNTN